MSRSRKQRFLLGLAVAVPVLALALSCSTDSPTEPDQVPPPPPAPGGAWNITVNVRPAVLVFSANSSLIEPSTVIVRVRRAGSGEPPPNGTTVVLTTSLGEFETLGSGFQSAVLSLLAGDAQVLMFPSSITGNGVVTAQLEGSVGQAAITVRDEETLFITAITPLTGSQVGGTRVTINGTGFTEPLQVFFNLGESVPAPVERVARNGTFVRVQSPPVFNPDAFFEVEACDADGDGEEDGERKLPTRSDIEIVMREGTVTTAGLSSGFTYLPSDPFCREPPEDPEPPGAPFILSVEPNTGPDEGGTAVVLTGRNFRRPLRLFFQNKLATITSSTSTRINAITPPGDLELQECDDDGDGIIGLKTFDTPVLVSVELQDGQSDSLQNGFTYLADFPGACIGD